MLSLASLLVVLSVSLSNHALELGLEPSTFDTPSARVQVDTGVAKVSTGDDGAQNRGGGGDLIFANGFETGTHSWSFSPTFIQFETSEIPNFNVDDCELPPGDYTFSVAADNTDGGLTYEYPLTVRTVPCTERPTETCSYYEFGAPQIAFR